MTRRGLLKGGIVLTGAFVLMARPWTWANLGRADDIATEPMENIPPFRRLLQSQSVSSGVSGAAGAILVGLEPPDPIDPTLEARLRADLTGVMWGDWDGSGPVPVTYFTDIRCPICRPLEARLHGLGGITLTTREYPVFGDASERAARAIVAAQQQGLGEEMRSRLQRSAFSVDREGLSQLAESAGVDAGQFADDFDGPTVTARLKEDRALARIFLLPGTPALIVGRTRMVGAPSDATLQALLEEEATLGRP